MRVNVDSVDIFSSFFFILSSSHNTDSYALHECYFGHLSPCMVLKSTQPSEISKSEV